MNIKLNSSILFFLRILKSFASIFILIITARFFGVGNKMDNWVAISTFIAAVTGIFFGSINEIFRSHFVSVLEKNGEKYALGEVYSLLFYTAIFCVIFIVLCFFGKQYIYKLFFTNEIGGAGKELFYNMLILTLPLIFINQVNGILIGILNSYDLFFIPEIVSIFTTISSIGILFFSVSYLDIYSLILSQYFASIVLFIILIIFVRKKGVNFFSNGFLPKFKDIKIYIYASAPLILPYLLGQINAVTEKRFINFYGQGYLSYINYSKQIIGVLQPVVFGVLMTIMVPQLTKYFVRNELENYKKNLVEYFDICVILCISIIPILYGGQYFICTLFFKHGNINDSSLLLITKLFGYYGLGFIGIIFYCYVGALYLTINKAKIYSIFGAATQVLILLLNFLSYRKFSVEVFPIIFSGAHLIVAILLLLILEKQYRHNLVFRFLKTFLITILLALFVKYFNEQTKNLTIISIFFINFLFFCGLLLISFFFTNNQIFKKFLSKSI